MFTKLCFVACRLSLTQVVNTPTHYISNSSSLIDLVFLSSLNTCNLHFCETVPPFSNSDHFGLFLAVTVFKSRSCPKRCGRRVWRYAFTDFELAHELLEAVDWTYFSPLQMPMTAGPHGKASSYKLWSLVFLRPLSSLVEIYLGSLHLSFRQ